MEFEGLKKNSTETHVDQTPNLVQALDQQELVVIIGLMHYNSLRFITLLHETENMPKFRCAHGTCNSVNVKFVYNI